MGCSDSKEAQTKDQNKPAPKPAPAPAKKDEPKKDDTQAEATKVDAPKDADNGDTWKTKDDAVQFLVKELGIKEENAKKIVDSVNDDEEGKLSEDEAKDLKKLVEMARDELKPLFESADTNGTGKVSSSEAAAVLAPKFPKMDEKALKKMIKSFDDGEKYVQYGEFILFYCFIHSAREELRAVFEAADDNNTGKVTLTEAATKLCEHFPAMDEHSVKKMLYRCSDGDGIVTYEEFIIFYAQLKKSRKTVMAKFEALDKDDKGNVKESDVVALLVAETGMEEDDCKALVNSTDEGNDARVSASEFIETWSKMSGAKK